MLARVPHRPENGDAVFAYRLGGSPRFDGQPEPWGDARGFDAAVYRPENWGGAQDLSGQFWVAWDEQSLYLAADITDDYYQPWGGAPQLMYRGDGLEVELDPDPGGTSRPIVHLGLRPSPDFRGGAGDAFQWGSSNQVASAVRVASRGRPGGYGLEAAIPWALLGVSPHPELAVGFCAEVDDVDVGPIGGTQELMLSQCPRRKWHERATYGTLVLMGERP